jgi:hypothetical protein
MKAVRVIGNSCDRARAARRDSNEATQLRGRNGAILRRMRSGAKRKGRRVSISPEQDCVGCE